MIKIDCSNDDNDKSYFNINDNYYKYDFNDTYYGKCVNFLNSYIFIDNYWTRLGKISWFVSGEQINYYLLKPEAEANNWSARHCQITIFCDNSEFNNYCFIIQSPFFWSTKYVKSLSACSGNRAAIFTQELSSCEKRLKKVMTSKSVDLYWKQDQNQF